MDPITGVTLGTKVVDITKHAIMRTISVLCVLAVIGGLVWAIYVAFVRPITKPNPTTTQNARIIENNYYFPSKKVFGIGVNLFGIDLGISKYDYPKEPVIKTRIIPLNEEVGKIVK